MCRHGGTVLRHTGSTVVSFSSKRRLAWLSSCLLACTTEPGLLDVGESPYIESGMETQGDDAECTAGAIDGCDPCATLTDGYYCGANELVEGGSVEPNDLLRCEGGTSISVADCASSCVVGPAIGTDACAIPSVCGDDVVGPDEACDGGPCCTDCSFRPQTHVCDEYAVQAYECPWGLALGSDTAVHYRRRFCSGTDALCVGSLSDWGDWFTQDRCDKYEGCVVNEPNCMCMMANAWDPSMSEGVDIDGRRYGGGEIYGLDLANRIEIVESGANGHLRARVCNADDPILLIQDPVHLHLEDMLGTVYFDDVLLPNGTSCSSYGELLLVETFPVHQVLSGAWRIVSPADVAGQWTTHCVAVQGNSAAGTCWWQDSIPTMERTCVRG
jgi:hypothetical protein